MKRTSAQLKQMAKDRLLGNYGMCIALSIIVSVISSAVMFLCEFATGIYRYPMSPAPYILYFVLVIILSLLISVFSAGLTYYYMNLCRGRKADIGNLLFAFKHHPDKFILVSLLLFLITFLCLVPGYVVLFIGIFTRTGSELLMAFLAIVLLIAGVVFDYILMLMFSQPYYILLDDPTKGVIQSMKESAQLMRGNKGRFFYINLSFIGWMLLGALSFGIGMLWVSAYLSATQVYFYLDITGELDRPAEPVIDVQPEPQQYMY